MLTEFKNRLRENENYQLLSKMDKVLLHVLIVFCFTCAMCGIKNIVYAIRADIPLTSVIVSDGWFVVVVIAYGIFMISYYTKKS